MKKICAVLLAIVLVPPNTHTITRGDLSKKVTCSVLNMPPAADVLSIYSFKNPSDTTLKQALDCVRMGSAKCRANESKAQVPLAQAASVLTCIEKAKPRSMGWTTKDVQKLQDLTQQYVDVVNKKCVETYVTHITATVNGATITATPLLTNNGRSC